MFRRKHIIKIFVPWFRQSFYIWHQKHDWKKGKLNIIKTYELLRQRKEKQREKIPINQTFNKGLVSRIYEKLSKLNYKKKKSSLKKYEWKIWIGILLKTKYHELFTVYEEIKCMAAIPQRTSAGSG